MAKHAKHARPRSARPAVCQSTVRVVTPRDRRCAARAAERRRPTMVGVVTNRADFERLQADGSTTYRGYGDYLRDVEALLDGLGRDGVEVRGRAFSPADFDDFCEREGISRADGDSHFAYTADPTAEEEWVRWEGEPLAEFLLRVDRAHERGLVRRQLDRMLAETAEAAVSGEFPEPLLRIAYARGAEALRGFLLGAGEGTFTVVCSLFDADLPLVAWADLRLEPGGVMRVDDEDLDLLCEVLCVGHALNRPGMLSLGGVCAVRGEVGWEWTFDGESFRRV
ncbi:hypothetical protein [Streptacidiphilus jiangxiensis]|uniref:Uncharacterized protein n=1 Tax=Streptacidiphilus jiangxiensis TaxID=235985 RepID=A0A1H7YLP6_STRJI|nr:hypothetical protein [Streptacidiphilus jiangxiensis]SEM46895.1 hypothetical protein SAMN05414137_12959 [Streptacidiphilus jiangxiensis]